MIEKVLSKILDNGLYVIPLFSVDNGICTCKDPKCSSPGKHPLFHINWKYVASCDKEKILGWMERYHKLNYAVATGRRSKITDKLFIIGFGRKFQSRTLFL
jgi:hypothetical protein